MAYLARKVQEFSLLRREPIILALVLVFFLFLLLLIIYPLFMVLRESLLVEGETSTANYLTLISRPYFRQVIYNTLFISILGTAGAVACGLVFAFGMTRTDMPGKNLFLLTAILPMITPPFVNAFAFILLFGRVGIVNQVLERFLGFKYIIYGWHGVVLAHIFSFFPLAYLITSAAFSQIDQSIEDAAQDLGANSFYMLRTITFPLITPGILAASLLIFMSNISSFGPPAMLGGDWTVLAVEAVNQTLGVLDWGMGTTLAVALLIPSFFLFCAQTRYKRGRSYVTVTGSPSQREFARIRPGIKWGVFSFCLAVSAFVLLVFGVILVGAFTQTWGINYSPSLRHFQTVFRHAGRSIWNSIFLAFVGANLAAFIGLTIAYLVVRKRFLGQRVMDYLATLPYAVPGTMIGLGLVLAFNRPPLFLVGTAFIILLDFVIRRMPFGLRTGVSTLQQIDVSIEEAASDLGASPARAFITVVIPLMKPAFIAGATFAFIRAMTEITSTIFLVTPRWRLMAVDIYNYVMAGQLGAAAALSTLLMAIIVGLIILVYRLIGVTESVFQM